MKTLEEIKKENVVVRTRLEKQDEMFKAQAETKIKLEFMMSTILSKLSQPPATFFTF